MNNKTIAAIATAQGQGGVGIIRISGEKAFDIADKVITSINVNRSHKMRVVTASAVDFSY